MSKGGHPRVHGFLPFGRTMLSDFSPVLLVAALSQELSLIERNLAYPCSLSGSEKGLWWILVTISELIFFGRLRLTSSTVNLFEGREM